MGPCSTTLRLAPAILIASLSGLASDAHDDNAPDGFGHVITFKPDCLQSHYQVRALTRKPDGTICREIGPIDLTIHRAKPSSVAFGGDNHTIHHDATGHAYDAPHWLDFDRDGQITAPPQSPPGATDIDRRFPIAYTRNTPMTIAAFETHFSKDAFGDMPTTYTIKGTGSDGSVYIRDGDQHTGVGSDPLPDHIAYLPNYSISWEISFEEGQTKYLWFSLGTTTHEVYSTLNDPVGNRLETAYHLAAAFATGAQTPEQAYHAINTHFSTRSLQNKAGMTLGYYRNTLCSSTLSSSVTAESLVRTGNGQCMAWARLYRETLRIHRLSSQLVRVRARHRTLSTLCTTIIDSGMLIRDYDFLLQGTPCQMYPFALDYPCPSIVFSNGTTIPTLPWPTPGVVDQPGQPGQDNPNPASVFAIHFLVSLPGNAWYDPSYGNGPWTAVTLEDSAAAWESTSVAGFPSIAAQVAVDGVTHLLMGARPKIALQREIDFDIVDDPLGEIDMNIGTGLVASALMILSPHSDPGAVAFIVPPSTDAELIHYFPLSEILKLEGLANATPEAISNLLRSEDPRSRAEGLFAAAFSGNLEALLGARHLLEDRRPAVGVRMFTGQDVMIPTRDLHTLFNVPAVAPASNAAVVPLSVGGYLVTMYRRYFGLPEDMSLNEITEFIAERAAHRDAWTFAHAWSARYEACMTPESASKTLDMILTLPENLRWAVAGEIMRTKGFNRARAVDHATLIVATLPVATLRSIESHSMPFPPDPVYAAQPHRMAAIYYAFESIPRGE